MLPITRPCPAGPLLALLLLLGAPACGEASRDEEPAPPAAAPSLEQAPNLLLIVADDLGVGDLGVTGAPHAHTPRLDALAGESLRFSDFYVDAPMCSASRASLLTGRTPRRHGLGTALTARDDPGLDLDEVLLPELLAERGYVTGLVGKWHLGHAGERTPTRRGFHEFFGMLRGSSGYYQHSWRGLPDLWRGTEPVRAEGRYSTELFTDEALAFIARHGERPGFLMLAYNAPHLADDRRSIPAPPEHRARFEGVELPPERADYLAAVAALDEGVGRVLDALAAADLERHTLVVFLSDNGALPPWGSNAPFAGAKDTLDEGGLRVPALLRWPGRVPAGAVEGTPVRGSDLFPTLLAAGGAPPPADRVVDGVDLLPLVTAGAPLEREALAFEHLSRRTGPDGQPRHDRMLRAGRWRLDVDRAGRARLFDLEADPAQTTDLSAAHPEVVAQLRAELARRLDG